MKRGISMIFLINFDIRINLPQKLRPPSGSTLCLLITAHSLPTQRLGI